MHTSGLIITIVDGADLSALADKLVRAGSFTLGQAVGSRLPLALEADSPEEAQHWHEWAASLPGVASVEVVFVHWEESEPIHA